MLYHSASCNHETIQYSYSHVDRSACATYDSRDHSLATIVLESCLLG
eukprot:SAG31_NODE_42331_length_272_cov_0.601156_1_plen_46_part_10